MKIKFVTTVILAAFAAAPFTSQAADKEVKAPKCACRQTQHQVALFVHGQGIAQSQTPRTITVTSAQTGQGFGLTFFTGSR
jgi:hypothetical protein